MRDVYVQLLLYMGLIWFKAVLNPIIAINPMFVMLSILITSCSCCLPLEPRHERYVME